MLHVPYLIAPCHAMPRHAILSNYILLQLIIFLVMLAVDTVNTGPAHGMLSRLQLGLAVRKAGALYPQAIQLAVSHLILEVLALESSSNSSSSSSSGDMKVEDCNTDVVGDEQTEERQSVYYGIFDALVSACGVPKMAEAITNYKQHTHVPMVTHTADASPSPYPRLVSALTSPEVIDILVAFGMQQAGGIGVGEFIDEQKCRPPGDCGLDVELQ